MKNKEQFTKEIVEIVGSGYAVAVSRDTGKPVSCNNISCIDCTLSNKGGCSIALKEWAESEYMEKPEISKKDREFLELFNDKCKYIARDSNGELHGYELTAMKDEKMGIWNTIAEYVNIDYFFAVDFPMVKWSDDEPWLIEDLKKLEVVEEYEKH